jgi:hypothetical protein
MALAGEIIRREEKQDEPAPGGGAEIHDNGETQ